MGSKRIISCVRFEVFTALTMKNAVFWDVALCRSSGLNRRFGGTYRLHLHGRKIRERGTRVSRWLQTKQSPAHAGSSLADFSTLKMEAIPSSETSVQSTRSTRRHNPEDGILHYFLCLDFFLNAVNKSISDNLFRNSYGNISKICIHNIYTWRSR
jgi:hypothetical protein